MLTIVVRTIANESHLVSVEESSTILELKNTIRDKLDIEINRQRLIYRGRVLQDECLLSEYQLEDQHVVHLVVRPVDVPSSPATTQSAPKPSLEHLRQGLLTIRTLFSSHESLGNGSSSNSFGEREYFLGQWLDVKDTVSQWLEATVMAINPVDKLVFIHYNGWPVRWDEWIPWNSPRLAPFRSHTAHFENGTNASPTPNTPVANAPSTGADDILVVVQSLAEMMRMVQPVVDRAAQWSVQRETGNANSELLFNQSAGELCSLTDRLGRVLVDLAPHLYDAYNRRGGIRNSVPGGGELPRTTSGSNRATSDLDSLFTDRNLGLRSPLSDANPGDYFRAPIVGARRPGISNLDSLLGRATPDTPGLLNIHIAIISPPQRPISESVSSEAASIQSPPSSLVQQRARLEELRQQQARLQQQIEYGRHRLVEDHEHTAESEAFGRFYAPTVDSATEENEQQTNSHLADLVASGIGREPSPMPDDVDEFINRLDIRSRELMHQIEVAASGSSTDDREPSSNVVRFTGNNALPNAVSSGLTSAPLAADADEALTQEEDIYQRHLAVPAAVSAASDDTTQEDGQVRRRPKSLLQRLRSSFLRRNNHG